MSRRPNDAEPSAHLSSAAISDLERYAGWLVLAPVLLAIAAYSRVLDGEFQFDDFPSFVHNSAVRDLPGLLSKFFGALLQGGRPVTELTFALNYATSRLEPWAFHATNVAVHVAAVALVFKFTRTVLRLAGAPRRSGIALFVAGAFALHPLQTQAVSYVTQRAEVLASAFYVVALMLLLQAERRGRSSVAVLAYLGGTAAFVLGLGAKVIVATAPAAYLLLTAAVPSEEQRAKLARWRVRIVMLMPWAALDGYIAWTTLRGMEGSKDAGFAIPGLPAGSYFLTQWNVVRTYLRLLFWPQGQAIDWAYPLSRGVEPSVLASGTLLLALAAFAAALFRWSHRRQDEAGAAARVAAFGIVWFFLVLLPTSSVVPLSDALMEHRVYLPSWGIFVAVAIAAERGLAGLKHRRSEHIALAGIATTWVALAALTYNRNAVWESRLSLWTDCATKRPHNWRARLVLGTVFNERSQFDRAIREYEIALQGGGRADPRNEAVIQKNLAAALMNAGRLQDMVAPLQRAVELDPSDADTIVNLASTKRKLGDAGGAEALAYRAVEVRPSHAPALALLGELRLEQGDVSGALPLLRRAAAGNSGNVATQINVAYAYTQLGMHAEACSEWRRALQLELPPEVRGRVQQVANDTCR